MGDWVNPRAGLDDEEKRKFLTLPGLELRPLSRPASSQSLYRLRYTSAANAICKFTVIFRIFYLNFNNFNEFRFLFIGSFLCLCFFVVVVFCIRAASVFGCWLLIWARK
jgi:hypothetical protein